MKALIMATALILYSLFAEAQPTVTDVINETKVFFESTDPFPSQMVGKTIDISISIIPAGVWPGFAGDNPVYSTNFGLKVDSLTSNPYPALLLPKEKGVKPKYLGGKGRFITTKNPCDKSEYWFRVIFPLDVSK